MPRPGSVSAVIEALVRLVFLIFALVILGAIVLGVVEAIMNMTASGIVTGLLFFCLGVVGTLGVLSSLGRGAQDASEIPLLSLPALDIYARRYPGQYCQYTQTPGVEYRPEFGPEQEMSVVPSDPTQYGPQPNPDPGASDLFFGGGSFYGSDALFPLGRPEMRKNTANRAWY